MRDGSDEDFFEVGSVGLGTEFCESAFAQELAVVDDSDAVAKFFDFAHYVAREDDGFTFGAAVADEFDNIARGENVKAVGGLVEDHDGRIVDDAARDGDALFHAGGEFVAPDVLEFGDVEFFNDSIDGGAEGIFGNAVEAGEIFDEFAGGEPSVKGGGGGKETDVGAD